MPPMLVHHNSALSFVLVFLDSKQNRSGLNIVFVVGEKRLDVFAIIVEF